MALKISNSAYGTLASGISDSDTTIVLSSGHGARFPTFGVDDWGYATLVNSSNAKEIIKITARSTDTLTAARAQDGTTALAFLAGDRIEMRPCAAAMNDKLDTATAASTYATSSALTTGLALKLDSATATSTYAKLAGGNTLSGVQKIAAQQGGVVALGSLSGTKNIDMSLGSTFTGTVAGSTTFTFTNPPTTGFDQCVYLKLTNGGAYTVSWPAGTKTASGTALSLTASGKDLLAIWYDIEQTCYVVGVVFKDYK